MAVGRIEERSRVGGKVLVISDSASLHSWRKQLGSLTITRHLPTVLFQFPALSDEHNQSVSVLAHDYQMECGCKSGSFLMSVTVVVIIISYFVSGNRLSGIALAYVVSFVGIATVAAFCGKLVGLLWARWRLLRLAASLCETLLRSSADRRVL